MTLQRFLFDPDPRLRPAWRALAFVPVYVLLLIALSLAAGFIAGSGTLKKNLELALAVIGMVSILAALLTAALFLPRLDRKDFRALGFWFYPGWIKEFGLGVAGGFLLVSFVIALQWLLGGLAVRGFTAGGDALLLAALWNLIVLLPAATGEELFFRGYPFQRLIEAFGEWPATALCATLFGLVHLYNPSPTVLSTLNTALVGILLAFAYLKTRGLWLPIGLHFAWNYALGFLYSLPVSGITLKGVVWQVEVTGGCWLTGCAYGPEGSLLTTLIASAAIVALAGTSRLSVSSQPAPAVQ